MMRGGRRTRSDPNTTQKVVSEATKRITEKIHSFKPHIVVCRTASLYMEMEHVLRQPGYPKGTRGFASHDCSWFAIFETTKE